MQKSQPTSFLKEEEDEQTEEENEEQKKKEEEDDESENEERKTKMKKEDEEEEATEAVSSFISYAIRLRCSFQSHTTATIQPPSTNSSNSSFIVIDAPSLIVIPEQ